MPLDLRTMNLSDLIPVVLPDGRVLELGKVRREKMKKRKWGQFQYQAKRRNLPISISEAHYSFIIDLPCMYCHSVDVGVDRARNNEAYTPENCVPCCTTCNMAKRGASVAGYISHSRKIAKLNLHSFLLRSASAP